MKYALLHCFLILSAILILTSCRKDKACPKSEIPSVTTEGKNTFGCLIDGEAWSPYAEHSLLSSWDFGPITTMFSRESKFFNIGFVRDYTLECDTTDSTIHFGINFDSLGQKIDYLSIMYRDSNLYISYDGIDSTQTVQFEVLRFDQSARILACTFSCTLLDEESGDRVVLEDDRFDITY